MKFTSANPVFLMSEFWVSPSRNSPPADPLPCSRPRPVCILVGMDRYLMGARPAQTIYPRTSLIEGTILKDKKLAEIGSKD